MRKTWADCLSPLVACINTMSRFVHALWYQCAVGYYYTICATIAPIGPSFQEGHSKVNWSIVERLCMRMGDTILWPLVLDYILKGKSEVRTSIYAFIDSLIIIEIRDQFLQTPPVLTSLPGWSVSCYHALQ